MTLYLSRCYTKDEKKAPHHTLTHTLSLQKIQAQRSVYGKEIQTESNDKRNNLTKTVMPQS